MPAAPPTADASALMPVRLGANVAGSSHFLSILQPDDDEPQVQHNQTPNTGGGFKPRSSLAVSGSGKGNRRISINIGGNDIALTTSKLVSNAVAAGVVPASETTLTATAHVSQSATPTARPATATTETQKNSPSSSSSPTTAKEEARTMTQDEFFAKNGVTAGGLLLGSPKPKVEKVIVDVGGKKFDLREIKKSVIGNTRITRNFNVILQSNQFDRFLVTSAEYLRWFLKVDQLERAKAQKIGIPSSGRTAEELDREITSAARGRIPNLFADGEVVCTLDHARGRKAETLREFAKAYCFLLLFASRHSAEPAKERQYFESIYYYTLEVAMVLLSLPSLNSQIQVELNRMFRSQMFSGSSNNDTGSDPSGLIRRFSTSRKSTVGGVMVGGGPPARTSRAESLVVGSVAVGVGGGGVKDAWVTGRPESGGSGAMRRVSRPASGRPGSALRKSPAPPQPTSIMQRQASVIVTMRSKSIVGMGKRVSLAMFNPRSVAPDNANAGIVGVAVDDGDAADREKSKDKNFQDQQEPDIESQLLSFKHKRKKRLSINDVRMARSPLADAVLPPPQRFLFVQTRASTIGSVMGV